MRAVLVAAAVLGAGASGVRADIVYGVIDLGVLTPGGTSTGSALNDVGQVVGSAQVASLSLHAATGSGPSGFVDLGTLPGGRTSTGVAINAGGVVVGDGDTPIGPNQFVTHAFRASGSGSLQDLGAMPGWTASHATGISDGGVISGYGVLAGGVAHAFVTTGGGFEELGTLGGASSQANGISGSGIVVGSSTLASGLTHAFRTGGGGLLDLGAPANSDGNSFGLGVNNLGVVVGYAESGNALSAFRATAPGAFQSLGLLAGTSSSMACAINDFNAVVGKSTFSTGSSLAFLYTDAGGLVDLNTLIGGNTGWVLNSATGINDRGEITGTGTLHGQTHAFLLTAVPEPSPLVLGALGALGAVAYRALRRGRTGGRAIGGPAGGPPAR